MPVHFRNTRAAIRTAIAGGLNVGLAAHQVLIGNTAGGIGQVAGTGTAGQVLTSGGPGADPAWQAPGGGPADSEVWLSGLAYPTGLGYQVLGETFPRILCSIGNPMSSGTPRFTIISLPAGKTLSRMTLWTGGTAIAGITHGWYAFADNNFRIVAVTADQTSGSTWSATHTPYTLVFTSSYTTAYRGNYYVFAQVQGSTEPSFEGMPAPDSGVGSTVPFPGGLGPTLTFTPPPIGTILTPNTVAPVGLYATVG